MPTLSIEQLAKKLGKASRSGTGWVCLCPAHDDRNPSLSLSWDNYTQKLLTKCHSGCSFESVMAALQRKGSNCFQSLTMSEAYKPSATSKLENALKIWNHTTSADSSITEKYLRHRGYTDTIPPTIRYSSRLYHSQSKKHYPAMVARVDLWPGINFCGIHRTYLSHDGLAKASTEPNKMMLGHVKGGAVRLTPPGQKLVIAEGIETALSVFQSTQLPTWAALSSTGMVSLDVPKLETTQEIIIAADGDRPGLDAAQTLAKRLLRQGYIVRIAAAPEGLDFNDVLRGAE